MNSDFSKNTIEILGKRSAYLCSNPDCRANTIGPNSNVEKATKIGEAAHIYGAREGAKRFNPEMTNSARAEITNGIWLCRNCHKLIDSDDQRYSATVLFKWREIHEEYITSNLGGRTDKIVHEKLVSILKPFETYDPIIKRIIIDKPRGWEYSLTAALMRNLYKPIFRRLNDLNNGLYVKELTFINKSEVYEWIQNRIFEMKILISPVKKLLESLTKSWGAPGVSGDVNEIHHIVKLLENYLEQAVLFEEKLVFSVLPKDFNGLVNLLKNTIGSQVKKLNAIPEILDEILITIENIDPNNQESATIKKEIVFNLPENWEKQFNEELNKVKHLLII